VGASIVLGMASNCVRSWLQTFEQPMCASFGMHVIQRRPAFSMGMLPSGGFPSLVASLTRKWKAGRATFCQAAFEACVGEGLIEENGPRTACRKMRFCWWGLEAVCVRGMQSWVPGLEIGCSWRLVADSIAHPWEAKWGMQVMTLLPKLARGITLSCRPALARMLRPVALRGYGAVTE
jgi:hypothetical protein